MKNKHIQEKDTLTWKHDDGTEVKYVKLSAVEKALREQRKEIIKYLNEK